MRYLIGANYPHKQRRTGHIIGALFIVLIFPLLFLQMQASSQRATLTDQMRMASTLLRADIGNINNEERNEWSLEIEDYLRLRMASFVSNVNRTPGTTRVAALLFDGDELLEIESTHGMLSRNRQPLEDSAYALAAEVAAIGRRPYRLWMESPDLNRFTILPPINIEWEDVFFVLSDENCNLFIVVAGQLRPYTFMANVIPLMLALTAVLYGLMVMYISSGFAKYVDKHPEKFKIPKEENPGA